MDNQNTSLSQGITRVVDDLNLAEDMKKSYQANLENGIPGMGGIVRGVNPVTGKMILKSNIIVQRGRTFSLEKLFGDVVPAQYNYTQNIDRTINLFRVGSGGAPAADPFNPTPPAATDEDLSIKAPFRIVDPNDPSTFLTASEEGIYFQPEVQPDGRTFYFSKAFDAVPTWIVNKAENRIYRSIQLTIDPKDVRGFGINELGLCISDSNHENIELFSRFTTETIPFFGNTGMVFEYLVYA